MDAGAAHRSDRPGVDVPGAGDSPSGEPARVLGGFSAACIVVGAIVGVGIFFTPSRVASLTGSGGLALLAWGIAGAIALCGALVFAELGARYHASGAQYQVLRDAYGACPAFLFVFCNATAIQSGAVAIISVICAQNLLEAAGVGEVARWVPLAMAGGLVLSIMVANAVGVRCGAAVQNLTVVLKLAALVAIAAVAAAWGSEPVLASMPASSPSGPPFEHGRLHEGLSPVAGVMAALVPAFFAYGGWQHALWISGEVKRPERTLPRAIVGGVGVVVVMYVVTAWATLRLLGVQGVAESTALAADAVGVVWPGWARRAVAGAVAISAFGVLNAQVLSGPRLVYGMARDGRFFPAFGRLSRRGTPTASIALIGGIAMGLLGLMAIRDGAIDPVLNGVVFIDGIFFALTGAALFVVRRRGRGERPSFRVPGYPVIPALFILGEVGVVAGSAVDPSVRASAWVGLAWIAAAALLYGARFRRRDARHGSPQDREGGLA